MLSTKIKFAKRVAVGYVQQYALDPSGNLVYTRIGGDPDHVRVFGHALKNGDKIKAEGTILSPAYQGSTVIGQSGEVGVLTYHTEPLFSITAGRSFFIARSEKEFKRQFDRVLQRRDLLYNPEWDVFGIIKKLGFAKPLDCYGGVMGYEIVWDEKIQEAISRDVKKKKLII